LHAGAAGVFGFQSAMSASTLLSSPFASSRLAVRSGSGSSRTRNGRTRLHCVSALPDQLTALSPPGLSRRHTLMGGLLVLASAPAIPAYAEEELILFKGVASPPTSYGGYGGNAEESFKYAFMVPSAWKSETVNKTEKGTQGVDCKFTNPKVKGMKAFVIALGRAGEDAKAFKITDVEGTFASFAGADYDIQDALTTADEVTTKTRDGENGDVFFEYDIDSPINHYQASISTKRGKIFALFIKTPGAAYNANKELTDTMLKSFTTL